jgi:hypothetical protein
LGNEVVFPLWRGEIITWGMNIYTDTYKLIHLNET